MKTWLRNKARAWADKVMIEIAEDWQIRAIRAEACAKRWEDLYRAAQEANGYLAGTGVQHDLAEARRLQERAERKLESARAEADLMRPVFELAQWWRAYDHAEDPDPETWARAETALKRAIDTASSAPAVRDGDNR